MLAAFWILTTLMVTFGLLVIGNRNPVASALSLVMCFLCLAGLFVTLDAYFIAVIQVLVYAGAVMVLFLFIIMLLDLRAEQARRLNFLALPIGLVLSVSFAFLIGKAALASTLGALPLIPLTPQGEGSQSIDDVREVGQILFTQFNLPFQIVGALLLVATIGVVVLSKRELK